MRNGNYRVPRTVLESGEHARDDFHHWVAFRLDLHDLRNPLGTICAGAALLMESRFHIQLNEAARGQSMSAADGPTIAGRPNQRWPRKADQRLKSLT